MTLRFATSMMETSGRQEIFFVRGKRHVPDALAHEKIFLDLMRRTVDHRDAIGRTERHKSCLAVPGDADPDRRASHVRAERRFRGAIFFMMLSKRACCRGWSARSARATCSIPRYGRPPSA